VSTLRELSGAATKGPWIEKVVGKHGYPQRLLANDDGLVLVAEFYEGPDRPAFNLALIVALRNACPEIIELMEAVGEELVAARLEPYTPAHRRVADAHDALRARGLL